MTSSLVLKIGVCSVTIISSLLFYLFYKKSKSVDNSNKTQIQTSRQTTIVIKLPEEKVHLVIGKNGSRVKEIQKDTQTKIYFNDNESNDELYRSCTIRGKIENIIIAEQIIRNIISSALSNEYYEMYIPNDSVGQLIGVGGKNIRAIQKSSRAKVTIDSNKVMKDGVEQRRIKIEGTREQIDFCKELIQLEIEEDGNLEIPKDLIENIMNERKMLNESLSSQNETKNNEDKSDDKKIFDQNIKH